MTGSTDDVDPRRPQPRADLSVFPLDDELVVYDPTSGESFLLNQSGRLVWELCNGERTPDDIARELAALHGIPTEQASTDTTELLESFRQARLLISG
jgi:PqqD family protein of HPr-rel-A system